MKPNRPRWNLKRFNDHPKDWRDFTVWGCLLDSTETVKLAYGIFDKKQAIEWCDYFFSGNRLRGTEVRDPDKVSIYRVGEIPEPKVLEPKVSESKVAEAPATEAPEAESQPESQSAESDKKSA
jgi:hypothetical protein